MSFQDAVRVCLTQKYADFTGRARRSEYWWFVVFSIIVGIIASIIDSIIRTRWNNGYGLIQMLANLALIIPGLAVGARRLHDTGRTAWWLLIGLVPIVGYIVLLIFFVQDSQGENQYGQSPKAFGSELPPPVAPQY
ncbi:MAG TPA: DUF805 domain-containing protein [Kineosporiaceae bacterium]|nr:DUF805 domain-containing protein [Kineosporiaceae bacterium]